LYKDEANEIETETGFLEQGSSHTQGAPSILNGLLLSIAVVLT
jgi:hypothetical protein